MVVLWIPNSLTSLANFFFSLNLLKICPWWNATFIIPFFFILIISSYCLIISALFQDLAFLRLFCLNPQILGFHLWSSNLITAFLSLLLINVSPFYYLPRLSTVILSFSHSSFKILSINSFFSRNIFLTAFKTAKTIFNRFLSILTTRVFFNFFTLVHYVFKSISNCFILIRHTRYQIWL